jgi:hypothetical protein
MRSANEFLDANVLFIYAYSVEDEGYIRTAYYTSTMRKARRYKAFRKLKPS